MTDKEQEKTEEGKAPEAQHVSRAKVEAALTCEDEGILQLSATLSLAQERLLAVLIDPIHYKKTNKQKADAAGIHITTLYAYLRDDDFSAVLQECCKAMLNSNLAPIFDAMNKTAAKEGREGTQDRKLALEVGGIIEGKGNSVTIQQNFSIGQLMDQIDGQTSGLPQPHAIEEKDSTK